MFVEINMLSSVEQHDNPFISTARLIIPVKS